MRQEIERLGAVLTVFLRGLRENVALFGLQIKTKYPPKISYPEDCLHHCRVRDESHHLLLRERVEFTDEGLHAEIYPPEGSPGFSSQPEGVV